MVNCKQDNVFFEYYDNKLHQTKKIFEEKENKCKLKAFENSADIVKACLER